MFESLTNGLTSVFSKLKKRGKITVEDIDVAMREIRIALLEADVSLVAIRTLINEVKTKAVGAEVIQSISPGQMIVKIVHDELIKLLGGEVSRVNNSDIGNSVKNLKQLNDSKDLKSPLEQEINLNLRATPPVVIMMVGLQGSGKTTTSAKLALHLRKKYKKNVLLTSVDIYRPAAQLQLATLAKQIEIDCLDIIAGEKPLEILERALKKAKNNHYDILIIDTAGRLQTDVALMEELRQCHQLTNPAETLFVCDSLIGQEAANIAKEFNAAIPVTGVVLTRLDSDTRGGAALSIKTVTGTDIKFVGMGEKLNDLQPFYPERLASSILGMGDVVSLVEKAAEHFEQEDAQKLVAKIQKGRFDLNDLLSQMRNIKKMGSITSLLSMVPGLGSKIKEKLGGAINDKIMVLNEAIICSMTLKERQNPDIINASRKRRIAKGAGTEVQYVNRLLKQYVSMKDMSKKVGKMNGDQLQNMMNQLINK